MPWGRGGGVCVRIRVRDQVPGAGPLRSSAQSLLFSTSMHNMTHRFNFSIENEHSYDSCLLPVCFVGAHLLPLLPPLSLLCSIIDKTMTVMRLARRPELL